MVRPYNYNEMKNQAIQEDEKRLKECIDKQLNDKSKETYASGERDFEQSFIKNKAHHPDSRLPDLPPYDREDVRNEALKRVKKDYEAEGWLVSMDHNRITFRNKDE